MNLAGIVAFVQTTSFFLPDKIGTCPPDPFWCKVPGRDLCSIDYDCPGVQKCCYFKCRKVCKDPLGIVHRSINTL
uniref:WAP domain-containing protein n=1 Tax=Salvator merianae TaxID=96440 RepID=A0A8D0BN26_SALMN